MAWTWMLLGAEGRPLRTTEAFSARDGAEAWLAEQWRGLAAEGAHEVALLEDGNEVYRMGLGEA